MFTVSSADLVGVGVGSRVLVQGEEGRHAVSVRRLSAGEAVQLTDGAGEVLTGRVAAATGRDQLEVEIEQVTLVPEPVPSITVVQALIKGDRMDRAIETLTEAGVDRIVPWAAHNCVVRWRPEQQAKVRAKLGRRVVEAGKQARRARFPELAASVTTKDLVEQLLPDSGFGAEERAGGPIAIVLHESAVRSLADLDLSNATEVMLLVGPEGGVTDGELEMLTGAGVLAARMGPTVMRASTAGTVALGAVMAATGRWSIAVEAEAFDVSD